VTPSFEFANPDLFTAGTIGPPGQRVFYLQAREGAELVTLKCEKEQVRALGEYLGRLLERLGSAPTPAGGEQGLVEPVTAAWVVGSIGVGYDEHADRVVIVLGELRADSDAPGEGEAAEGASGRVRLTRAQTAAFVERAQALVAAGRPSCRLCGQPVNPGGHRCPRTNGHRLDPPSP
jgi:uncharacterized repeat protein (TIGR03847 family)